MQKLIELYDKINEGKQVFQCATPKFPVPGSGYVEHEQISIAHQSPAWSAGCDGRAGIINAVMDILPAQYDSVVWRIRPELTFLRYDGNNYEQLKNDDSPYDIIKIYLRLSFVNQGRQVYSKQNSDNITI